MRVLLTTLNAKYIHTNLALRYLRAYCRDLPVDLQLREFTINDFPEHIAAVIYRQQPDLVAFSCYIWNIEKTLAVIEILKTVKPELTILCGGPEVSFETQSFMRENPSVDMVITGEGEKPFRKLMEQITDQAMNPRIIPGLAYREGEKVLYLPEDTLIESLDTIPFPYTEDLTQGAGTLRHSTVYYETSRGCPFNCSFCLSSSTRGVRYFSLERIKSDLTQLIKAGAREIKFVDRTFNADKKRALAIWDFLLTLNPPTRFYFEITGELLDEETLVFLTKIPPRLIQMEIGIQSIDPAVNKNCNRHQDWDRLSRVIQQLLETTNIRLHLDLIAGLPGEDYAGVARSFDAVALLKPQEIQLGFLKLFKGTPLRKQFNDYGYLFVDRPPYEVLASGTLSYDEMIRLHHIEALYRYYGNSHLADTAFAFLADFYNSSLFACYEALAEYWEEKSCFNRGHNQRSLFNLLSDFAAASKRFNKNPDLRIFYQLLKYDFLYRDRSRQWPEWVPPSPLSAQERSDYMERIIDSRYRQDHLPELLEEIPANLRRHGFLELFTTTPEKPWLEQPAFVFFYYGPPGSVTRRYIIAPGKEI